MVCKGWGPLYSFLLLGTPQLNYFPNNTTRCGLSLVRGAACHTHCLAAHGSELPGGPGLYLDHLLQNSQCLLLFLQELLQLRVQVLPGLTSWALTERQTLGPQASRPAEAGLGW